jgi:translation initiation factor 1 (eIF-1/SUI1)
MNIAVIVVSLFVGVGVFSQYKTNKMVINTETPKYQLIEKYDQFEVRKYPKMILATTVMGHGKYSRKSVDGFRTVASYIFGGNDQNKQISMTAPVMASMGDTMRMSFIMPSIYKLEELPSPTNENVEIQIQPERLMAIISFGGFANDYDIKYYTKKLKEQLVKEGFLVDGKVYFQGYDPPFQLFNRTNEVAIEIEEKI